MDAVALTNNSFINMKDEELRETNGGAAWYVVAAVVVVAVVVVVAAASFVAGVVDGYKGR